MFCRGLGVGHEHFGDCVAALAAAMRNPVHEELSIGAAWALQGVARRLAEALPAVSVTAAMGRQHDACAVARRVPLKRVGSCRSQMQPCNKHHALLPGES